MEKEFRIITEGVFILASSSSLVNKYSEVEFDYDFPYGFLDLLENNAVIAISTPEGDQLNVNTQINRPLNRLDFDKVICQYLNFDKSDELLMLSHAEFTMICANNKGNYSEYGWPLSFHEKMEKGRYKIEFGIKDVSEDFEKYQAYYSVIINISKSDDELVTNEVCEIGE